MVQVRVALLLSVGLVSTAACGTLIGAVGTPGGEADAGEDGGSDGDAAMPPPAAPPTTPPSCPMGTNVLCADFETLLGDPPAPFQYAERDPITVTLETASPAASGATALHMVIHKNDDASTPDYQSFLGWTGAKNASRVTCDFELRVNQPIRTVAGEAFAVFQLQFIGNLLSAAIFLDDNDVILRRGGSSGFEHFAKYAVGGPFVPVHFEVDVGGRTVVASYGGTKTPQYPFLDTPDAASVDDLRVGIENLDTQPLSNVDVSIDQVRCTVVR